MDKKQIFFGALILAIGIGVGSAWPGNPSQSATDNLAQEEPDPNDQGEENQEGHLALSDEQINAAGIQLVEARAQTISSSLTFPGEIRFDEGRTAHIAPRVPGVVESVHVDLGQAVKKGQLLAVIASQQVSDQRSGKAAAQRRLELARTTYQRERQLWLDKISAEQDFLQARQAMQEAEIALSNARQNISVLSGSSEVRGGNRYELRAPFDGVVVEKHLNVGEVVSETTNAFTLSDLSRLWVTFGVYPQDLSKVLVGKTVTISATELNTQVTGTVAYVGSLLDEQTRTATVRVTLDNPQGVWRPGLFATVQVETNSRLVNVAVPDAAIQTIEGTPTVFVRTDDGFQARPVEVGSRSAGLVEITEGLESGIQVAAAGSFTLKSELGKASAEHGH